MSKMCPQCQQPLHQVERWGVQLDVCKNCQGVWLEAGELEQIVGFVRASLAQGDATMPVPHSKRHHDDDDDDEHRVEYDQNGGPRRKRRFEFGDLFDIFG